MHGGESGGEMSSCRASHDSDFIGIDTEFGSFLAHDADCLSAVLKRDFGVSVGYAIFQDSESYPLSVHPVNEHFTLIVGGEILITAAGSADYSLSVRFLCRQEDISPALSPPCMVKKDSARTSKFYFILSFQ